MLIVGGYAGIFHAQPAPAEPKNLVELFAPLRSFPDAKVVAWLDRLSKDIQFVSVVR